MVLCIIVATIALFSQRYSLVIFIPLALLGVRSIDHEMLFALPIVRRCQLEQCLSLSLTLDVCPCQLVNELWRRLIASRHLEQEGTSLSLSLSLSLSRSHELRPSLI